MPIVQKTVQRVGNSSGVILPPETLAEAGISRGDPITIRVERGHIIIAPVATVRPEVLEAGERVIQRYAAVFELLAR